MVRALVLSLCALIVSGSSVFGQNTTQIFSHKETGIRFPAKLGRLDRGEVKEYGRRALGISVHYSGPHLVKADVYVYDMGLKGIPNGVGSKILSTA